MDVESESYRVKVENVFEGPMDLLIHLIKKNEVDIYDIPIALITDQYLEYLQWLQKMNIDLAGDFLVMAATLAQIKSKMLLPAHERDEDEDDPRLEITRPLVEYLQMKSAAEELAARPLLGDATFHRKSDDTAAEFAAQEGMIQIGLFELIDAFKQILDKMPSEQRVEITADRISVKERISQLVDILESKGSITFDELFETSADVGGIIVTFLATLEMAKLGLIQIAQHLQTGVIRLFYA